MLKLQIKGQPATAKWLVANTVVGKAPDCDFVLTSKTAGDKHIELLVDHDTIYLQDRSYGKSIFVNGMPVGEYGPFKHKDIITLGDCELEIIDPKAELAASGAEPPLILGDWKLRASGDWLAGKEFIISQTSILGRDTACDIPLAGTYLSRRHAQLTPAIDGLSLQDLGSANGCFVNGRRVDQALLRDGDEVCFDVLKFTVIAPLAHTDVNKTFIRAVKPNTSQPLEPVKAEDLPEKQWKTKPTSLGNRAPEDEIVAQINGPSAWVYYAVAISVFGAAFAFAYYFVA